MKKTVLAAGAASAGSVAETAAQFLPGRQPAPVVPFGISLAEWSLHHSLSAQKLAHLDFPRIARGEYGIDAIELVNQFFKDKATDASYLRDFKKRADDAGVKVLLVMCDGEGELGDANESKRQEAVDKHRKWVDAAKGLGCHSIRVNALSSGSEEEQRVRLADGLHRLCEYAAKLGLNVLLENHGCLSSNAAWLTSVVTKVGLPNCGTLPDFGNWYDYDRYRGVAEMMPYARAVSAKSKDFDAAGNETHTDYRRMIKTVLEAGYQGYLGIEYEGEALSERDGIRATKRLLERVRGELTPIRQRELL